MDVININIKFAQKNDINGWIELLILVRDSFPGLDLEEYEIQLRKSISDQEAIVAKIDDKIVGTLAFSKSNNELSFLATHPDYRRKGIAQKLIEKFVSLFTSSTKLHVITYRENDSQGIAARELYKSMGFIEGDMLTVFDYLCQEMIYTVE